MALCLCCQRVARRYMAGWRGASENPAFFSRWTKDANVDPAEVSQNGGSFTVPMRSLTTGTGDREGWHVGRSCEKGQTRDAAPAGQAPQDLSRPHLFTRRGLESR